MSELRWRAFQRMQWIWSGWERLQLKFYPITPIRPGALFATRKNGTVLELHLDSRSLNRMRLEPNYSTFKAVRRMREDLAALASTVRGGALGPVTEIKATSLLGGPGAVLGFQTRPAPRTIGNALQHYFMVGLDAIYNPRGLRESSKRRWLTETRMSVSDLLARY